MKVPPNTVPVESKAALLRKINGWIREYSPWIRQVSLTYGEGNKNFVILNSQGGFVREERSSLVLMIRAVAEKNGILQTGHEVVGAVQGFEFFEEVDLKQKALDAAARAVSKLDCPLAPAGEMMVGISSSAGGTLIHEAIGHSLEADHVQEGTSPIYKGKLGSVVASERITVIDDPTLPHRRGSFVFDDEGMTASPTVLVENGVLKSYLYDRLTAMRDRVCSNAHGRRESYHHRPIPRMSNLYISPWKEEPEDILRSISKGLWVTRMGGGQVNTATGEFVFEVDEGYWVEDGRIRHRVRDASLLGVGSEVLRSIDRVGKDIGWDVGTCGKDGQGVPVSDGIPTLRIPKILVGGRTAG